MFNINKTFELVSYFYRAQYTHWRAALYVRKTITYKVSKKLIEMSVEDIFGYVVIETTVGKRNVIIVSIYSCWSIDWYDDHICVEIYEQS